MLLPSSSEAIGRRRAAGSGVRSVSRSRRCTSQVTGGMRTTAPTIHETMIPSRGRGPTNKGSSASLNNAEVRFSTGTQTARLRPISTLSCKLKIVKVSAPATNKTDVRALNSRSSPSVGIRRGSTATASVARTSVTPSVPAYVSPTSRRRELPTTGRYRGRIVVMFS